MNTFNYKKQNIQNTNNKNNIFFNINTINYTKNNNIYDINNIVFY